MAKLLTGLAVVGVAVSSSAAGGSAKDSLIAFVRQQSAATIGGQIFVMNADGSGQRRLTRGPFDNEPAWSPDGAMLVFTHNGEIYAVNANGSGLHLLKSLGADSAISPTWSPDGRKIAFSYTAGMGIMNANGSGQRLLAKEAPATLVDYVGLRWSPDGKKILFYADSGIGKPSEVFIINADGNGRLALTRGPDSNETPDWSPDGKKIIFVRQQSAEALGGEIFVMNADGSGQRSLKTSGYSPAWSRDGKKIVFGRFQNSFHQLYVMNADGTRQHSLTRGKHDFAPAWQPLLRRG